VEEEVERAGDHHVEVEAKNGTVEIGDQPGPEQADLAHCALPVGHRQRRIHLGAERFVGQRQNLDAGVEAMGPLGHAEETDRRSEVAPHPGIEAIDVFGPEQGTPLDAGDIGGGHDPSYL